MPPAISFSVIKPSEYYFGKNIRHSAPNFETFFSFHPINMDIQLNGGMMWTEFTWLRIRTSIRSFPTW